MNKQEKFENFLESLKGNGKDSVIESIEKAFQLCFENEVRKIDYEQLPNIKKYFQGAIEHSGSPEVTILDSDDGKKQETRVTYTGDTEFDPIALNKIIRHPYFYHLFFEKGENGGMVLTFVFHNEKMLADMLSEKSSERFKEPEYK